MESQSCDLCQPCQTGAEGGDRFVASMQSLGCWALTLDARYWAAVAIVGALALLVVRGIQKKSLPTHMETFHLVLAIFSLYSAVNIFAVLILTKPPAIVLLGATERFLAGIFTTGVLLLATFPSLKSAFVGAPSDSGGKGAAVVEAKPEKAADSPS